MNPYQFLLAKIPSPYTGQLHRAAATFLMQGLQEFPAATFRQYGEYDGEGTLIAPAENPADMVFRLSQGPSSATALGRRLTAYLRSLAG